MKNVYEECPAFANEKYALRLISADDTKDLLKVYSDTRALPIFNSDNCDDDFHYETLERMQAAVDFWTFAYAHEYFVRWTILDRATEEAIGTIELFNRVAEDHFTNCGLLRLDLRSDYEKADAISSILGLIVEPAYALFGCEAVAMKIPAVANERRAAATAMGFVATDEKVVGKNGTEFGDYYERGK